MCPQTWLDSAQTITLVTAMASGAALTSKSESASVRIRQILSLICALVFLLIGIVHTGHATSVASTAPRLVVVNANDATDGSAKADQVLVDVCHCCVQAALPAANAEPDSQGRARSLPGWTASRMDTRGPITEPRPPRIPT